MLVHKVSVIKLRSLDVDCPSANEKGDDVDGDERERRTVELFVSRARISLKEKKECPEFV